MPTEFNFEVSDKLKEKFPNEVHNYHAEQIDNDTYKITWIDDDNPSPFAYYNREDLEDRIYRNDWIVKEDK